MFFTFSRSAAVWEGGTGAPPASIFRMLATRSGVKFGCSSMSRTIVGTPVKRVARSRSMVAMASPASHFRIIRSPAPMGMDQRKMGRSAVMWKRGTAMRDLEPGSGMARARSSPILMAVPRLRCVWQTPFGKPVLPEVYMIMASSSAPTPPVPGRGFPRPAARRSPQRTAPSSRAAAASPRQSTAPTPSRARKGRQSARRSGSQTM
mmetsp:Transcript_111235/g.314849  ORF Transcript_111235/g.314849 Transcript_111235/m.314849 type:complete len:206 (+) Transcript_111235:782-1399(+)